jgi:hypothetical protein
MARLPRRLHLRTACALAGAAAIFAATGCSAPPNNVARNWSIAGTQLKQRGWSNQALCLINLWNVESSWNVYALNKSSGAYGIPQALPANRMASAGPDWLSNPSTQIRWGLNYIAQRYGTPCNAWKHEQQYHWYLKTGDAGSAAAGTPAR